MAQKSTRTRELCHTYLGVLETAEIDPMVVTAYRRLILSHNSLSRTAVALHADTTTLRAELAAAEIKAADLLAEIKAMHEANSGAIL